ncbi:MAG TPA: cytochrome c oxidase assembly protein, partial [Pseudolabrys sp.]|nr:cytochrome c oxidase assembly protein [Pseudolabrys sp.]
MSQIDSPARLPTFTLGATRWPDAAAYLAVGCISVLLWWLCRSQVSALPAFAPWDFSFVEFAGSWLAAWWYWRGLTMTPRAERPGMGRQVAFFAGLVTIYVVLETHFEYLAEHQFFYNRLMHAALHHLGPFLLAISWPGATLARGVPAPFMRLSRSNWLNAGLRVLQQPVIAGFVFVALIFFWLVPPIHFRAMIDPRLFRIMNWSMVLDGVLFWFIVLDPRPCPPAKISAVGRLCMAGLVIVPQVMGGALITLARSDIYPYYDLCGR